MENFDARVDHIEQRLPEEQPPRLHARTAVAGVLEVPIHVAVVRHAAWIPKWTTGSTWGAKTMWAEKIPLGLDSAGSIRHDVAVALAAHNAHELADLVGNSGWEWVADAVPSLSWRQSTEEDTFGDVETDDLDEDRKIRREHLVQRDSDLEIVQGPQGNPYDQASQYARIDSRVTIVPPEDCKVVEYATTPSTGSTARRSESVLVKDFERWLIADGHEVQRLLIRPIGESDSLVTETYDVTGGVLYEAKSKADRATIRLGIGQLLDYLRFVDDVKGSLLLPLEPSYDLRSLIFACGLSVTYPKDGSWTTEE